MSQHENGYEVAQNIWTEIEPFYKKFQRFVLDRINHHYKTNFTNIPVYLTGNNFGDDWSNIAEIILPHQKIYHDAKDSISKKVSGYVFCFRKVRTEGFLFQTKTDIYKHCNKVSRELTFKDHSRILEKHSRFDLDNCDSKVLSFCAEEYSM